MTSSFFRATYPGVILEWLSKSRKFSGREKILEELPSLEEAEPREPRHDEADNRSPNENTTSGGAAAYAHGNSPIIVDWDGLDDPDCPRNWPLWKRLIVAILVYFYTFAVYLGGAIFASAEKGVAEEFQVSHMASGVGFALYLIGYGVGPLIFSPLSEHSRIGRNPPYMISMLIFVALCVPTALTNNFSGLLVLRFFLGFFGSPCLATGGASLGDVFYDHEMPFALMSWAFAMTLAPATAPIIGGFSVPAMGWRWISWELLWASGPVFIGMVFFMPETSHSTLLRWRAQALRSTTGSTRYVTRDEIRERKTSGKDTAFEVLIRPWNLIIMDPVILYVDIFSSLCYGITYSFFESFPIVYRDVYGFSAGEMGTAFVSIIVGSAVAGAWYISYNYYVVLPRFRRNEDMSPESRLYLALYSTPLMPVGLFIFAWTSRSDVHWIYGCLGVAITMCGLITMYQCVFLYLPLAYPRYAASLFAGNDFARSALAGAAVIFSRPLFGNLGIGPGVSLLAGLTLILVPGIYVLYFWGHKLRAKSRFAE